MRYATREKLNLETGNEIIRCISEKDFAGLKNLFSEEAIECDTELDSEIKKLFNYCGGEIKDVKKVALSMHGKMYEGKDSTEFHTSFEFFINEICFELDYIFEPKNLFDNKKTGLRTVRVLKKIDEDKYFCYWEDMKPGIFVPED